MGVSSLIGPGGDSMEAPNIQLSLKTFVFCLLEKVSDDAIHKDGMVVDPERSVVWKP